MAAAPEAGPVKVRGLETRKFPIWIPHSLLVKKVNIECYERLTDSKQFMEIVMQTIKNGFTILKFLCVFPFVWYVLLQSLINCESIICGN